MRKRQTFLLTVVAEENETASFCGRLKVIASGKTRTFTNLEDLYHLIESEMDDPMRLSRMQANSIRKSPDSSKAS